MSYHDGIKNAIIKQTNLGYHDGHGSIKNAWLHLDYGNSGQGFGGYTLGKTFTDAYIYGILGALEADSWEKLVGMHCRADVQGGIIKRIGHILKDKWFDPVETANKLGLK